MGVIGLHPEKPPQSHRASLGYWIAHAHWNKGYATEALLEILRFGFEEKKLYKIYGHYWVGNEASKRVMEKVGMRVEGVLRGWDWKVDTKTGVGSYRDSGVCGILKGDWEGEVKMNGDGGR